MPDISLEKLALDLSWDEMQAYVKTLPQKTQDNVTAVKREDRPLMNINYHEKKVLTCGISKRAHPSEERDTPRVHTCPSLTQCLTAFGEHKTLFTKYTPVSDDPQAEPPTVDWYRGGAYVYHLYDWDVALKPSKELVYDAQKTEETWLVNYNGEQATYGVTLAGKIFMRSVVFEPVKAGKKPSALEEWFLHVVDPQGMYISADSFVLPGYWRLLRLDDRVVVCDNLVAAQFKLAKNLQASMLSYVNSAQEENYPAVFSW